MSPPLRLPELSLAASRLMAKALVWDNTFPFGPSCGSMVAHEQMLDRMRWDTTVCR